MKSLPISVKATVFLSHPVRGAWIEIYINDTIDKKLLSHPVRGAWIEMPEPFEEEQTAESHPVRGAWIEIIMLSSTLKKFSVAPRQGCVD